MQATDRHLGTGLKALLGLYIIAGALGFMISIASRGEPRLLVSGLCIALIICAIGLWNWKSWGFYGLVATQIGMLIILKLQLHPYGLFKDLPTFFLSTFSTPTTWVFLISITLLMIVVKPIGDRLD